MSRRALVVCTANVCRSPSAERLLQRRLDGMVDLSGERWVVRSAATSSVRAPPDSNTEAAATAVGIDLRGHAPRHLDREILHVDGSDLVLAMTRAQLREVIGIDSDWWPRTFTLKEIVRRAGHVRPSTGDDVTGWLRRMAAGRRAVDMMKPDPIDDIADPYGAPRRQHDAMIAELSQLLDALVHLGPWREDQSDQ